MTGMSKSLKRSMTEQSQKVLRTGSRFTRFDQLRQRHFWSSYYFAQDANGYVQSGNFPLFVVPTGQNGQGFPSGVTLTDRETNWKSQNRVPDNQNFEITEVGISLGMITNDVYLLDDALAPIGDSPELVAVPPRMFSQFLNNTLLSITYLTNTVPLGLCVDFGQASAPHLGVYQGTNINTYYRSNGFPAPALRRRFKIPILLQHGETFAFQLNIPRSYYVGPISATEGKFTSLTDNTPFVVRMDFWATESFVEKS